MKTIQEIATLVHWDGKFESQANFSYEITAKEDADGRLVLAGSARGWNRNSKATEVLSRENGRDGAVLVQALDAALRRLLSKVVTDARFPVPSVKLAEFSESICRHFEEQGFPKTVKGSYGEASICYWFRIEA